MRNEAIKDLNITIDSVLVTSIVLLIMAVVISVPRNWNKYLLWLSDQIQLFDQCLPY